ncbi:MAG: carbohydrate binding family 9 domain-containing protein [Gemmatimonadota bacterium]|nr:carbohydrate binding family 9 domain-containing protein [Gemmatimonadota bacterium]
MLQILTLAALTAFAPAIQQLGPGSPGSEIPDDRDEALVFRGSDGELEVRVPRVSNVEIRIDGRLDEEIWRNAAVITGFTQYEPVEGIPATENTEVYVVYSSDAIYFGIRAFDSEPDLILARLGERDRSVFGDDWVRIMLDTFNDQRQAYVFYVNPLGIQTDGLWIEGMQQRMGMGGGVSIDFNPDFIWESDGRVDDQGWAAEIKIPYVSLRFENVPVQDWGINVTREVKRRGFKQSWAPLTQNISSTLAQSGHLVGLEELRPRRLVEINPVATGLSQGDLVGGQLERGNIEPDFGINGRIGVTQNLVFDATFNPDFSQIEADNNRITVNERFALFFPEKRPFFLEGTEIFRTPRNLVHTRRIIDPIGGAKLTGKIGSFNVGYLGAIDESPRTIFGDPNAGSISFNVLRVRRDIGTGSNVGFLFTNRSGDEAGGFNRVAAVDLRYLFNRRYTFTTQIAGSWTSDSLSDPARFRPLINASLQRSGRNWGWNIKLDDVHSEFDAGAGFIPRVGDTEVLASISNTKFGRPGSTVERLRTEFRINGFFDHDDFWSGGSPFEGEIELQPTISFKGDRSLTFVFRDGLFRFRPEDYLGWNVVDGSGALQPFVLPPDLTHMLGLAIFPRARITNEIQLNARTYLRTIPIFAEAARGFEIQFAPDITLKPTTSFQLSLSHTFSRIWRSRDNTEYSTVNIPRIRTQYQFSKALSTRLVVQYELEHRSALRHPLTGEPVAIWGVERTTSDTGEFQAQFLLSYEPSPGTTFFAGYSRLEEGERTFRFSGLNPVNDRFFVKMSYLFRM